MQTQTVDTLNDLVKIKNDRIEGYKRAMEELKDLDVDLKATFSKMMADSEQYRNELTAEVAKNGGEAATDSTTNSGKIYRVWMDLKVTFAGDNRLAVLENCEFGEDAAQRAYKMALEDRNDITPEAYELVLKQQTSLKEAHDKIKAMRNTAKEAK